MRRILAVGVAAFALLGVLRPDAFAQAPTPTFRINGLIDQVGTYAYNVSNVDSDFHRKDTTFYGRTRGRWDIIGEYGKVKGVLGLEADLVYGQTGLTESNIATAAAGGGGAAPAAGATFVGNGTDGGVGLNSDVRGILEIKWLYTEFEVPFIPAPTMVRLGVQPWGSIATYKLAAYASGDFAGVNFVTTINPNVRLIAAFAQTEEAMSGRQTNCGSSACNVTTTGNFGVNRFQLKGDDWAVILAPEVTPVKGLDIKPMYSYFSASGTTQSSSRSMRGGINNNWFQNATGIPAAGNTAQEDGTWRKGINEDRNTVGIDARWNVGGFYLNPTINYQFGSVSRVAPNAANIANGGASNPTPFQDSGVISGRKYNARLDAWLIDIRSGFQIGPLLLEGMLMYTTGNHARNNTLNHDQTYQPLDTDTGYLADWGPQLTALGVDYLQAMNEGAGQVGYQGNYIGYDKYGRIAVSPRVTYAWTPLLSMYGGVIANFTATEVQRNASAVYQNGAAAGVVPIFNCNGTPGGRCGLGTSRYMGTELFTGVDWKFAPGITWSNAAGYMFTGDVFDTMTNPSTGSRDAHNVYIVTSRVRFTF